MFLAASYNAVRMTKGATLAGFMLHLMPKSKHTQQAYRVVLQAFLGVCPSKIRYIRSEHIERYLMSLKHANSTKNLHLAAIRSFFQWVENNYDIRSPARRVEFLKTLPPKQRVLSEEEYHKLVVSNPTEVKNIILFLCHTGVRAGEFLSLSPANFTSDFLYVTGKGNKERAIPLNPLVKSIWPHLHFSMSKKKLWRICQKAAFNAKIKPFSAHSCRHYFATQLYKSGIRLSIVSKLLGHSSSSVTEKIYLHLKDADLLHTTDCLV